MHKFFTRFRIGLIILFGFIFIASATLLFLTFGRAESEGGYYYNQLNIEAKRFYNAIDDMNNRGDLKTGAAEYDLIANNTVTEALLSAYSSNASLLVAFGAARDAYALDHADVFYVDFSYLSISVGTQNGKLGATLGTGRADNYYLQGGFSDEDGVAEALEEFDAAVSLIVAHAKAAGNSVVDQIKDVNAQLIETTEYSFCSVVDENGETEYLDGAPFIRTAYGALVKHKSVCEGYARAFKTVMDKLEIPCVLVQGYAQGADGGYEPHMWNYVQVDGH